jgi:cytochrome P450
MEVGMDDQLNPFAPEPEARMASLATLRARCPVASLGAHGPHLALSHDAVAAGLKSVEYFGGSAAQEGLDEDDKTIAGILEPRHGQIRRVFNQVVAFHRSQAIEPYLEELATRLIRVMLADPVSRSAEGIDVMSTFVEPIPPRAMVRLAGFPEADADLYYAWANRSGEQLALAVAEGRPLSMADGAPEFAQYVDDRIDARLATPRDEWPNDALSRFFTTEIDGVLLSRRSIRIQIMFMIGAGSETTRNHIGNMLFRLAQDPDLYARLRSDRTLVEPVIEESLRYDAPAQFMVRRCLRSTDLDGVSIAEGEQIFLSLSAANHDASAFEEPERFSPSRSTNRDHVSFGTGPHICPGAGLARVESRVALTTFLDHVESVELGEAYVFDHGATGMLHGPKTLRLCCTPAAPLRSV